MKPSGALSASARKTVLAGAAVLLALAGVAALVLLGNDRRGPAAALDSGGAGVAAERPVPDTVRTPAETAQIRQEERPRITPPRVRDSAPVLRFPPDSSPPLAVQDLPGAGTIRDPATRDAARRKAEQIYAREDAAPEVRAEAAFAIARVREEEERWTEARTYFKDFPRTRDSTGRDR